MARKRGFDDAEEDLRRMAMRHESLQQDFDELREETDAIRKQLQRAKAKKGRLLAEVRFLRRRYRFLKKGVSGGEGLSSKQGIVVKRQETDNRPSLTRLPPLPPSSGSPPVFHHKQQQHHQPEPQSRGFLVEGMALPLPCTGYPQSVAEMRPLETKEFQVLWEPLRAATIGGREEASQPCSESAKTNASSLATSFAENSGLANDLRLSIFKDIPNAFVLPVRPGSRKISWQDPMALRV